MTDYASGLKKWRADAKLTQKEAATALGVSLNTYISWENDRRKPMYFNKRRIDALLQGGE